MFPLRTALRGKAPEKNGPIPVYPDLFGETGIQTHFADGDVEVVGLGRNDSGGFVLSAALAVTIAGVDQKTADNSSRAPTPSVPTRMRSRETSMSKSPFRLECRAPRDSNSRPSASKSCGSRT